VISPNAAMAMPQWSPVSRRSAGWRQKVFRRLNRDRPDDGEAISQDIHPDGSRRPVGQTQGEGAGPRGLTGKIRHRNCETQHLASVEIDMERTRGNLLRPVRHVCRVPASCPSRLVLPALEVARIPRLHETVESHVLQIAFLVAPGHLITEAVSPVNGGGGKFLNIFNSAPLSLFAVFPDSTDSALGEVPLQMAFLVRPSKMSTTSVPTS
jgi:hypothetical protein